jgi:hypothetical protein
MAGLRTGATMGMVALIAGAGAILQGGFHLPQGPSGWGGLAGLTLLYGTAFTVMFTLLPRLGVVGNSAIMNVEPVFALVMAWLLLGQKIEPVQVAGALICCVDGHHPGLTTFHLAKPPASGSSRKIVRTAATHRDVVNSQSADPNHAIFCEPYLQILSAWYACLHDRDWSLRYPRLKTSSRPCKRVTTSKPKRSSGKFCGKARQRQGAL